MKNLLTKGLNVSVTLKNSYAQVIISIGILILCVAIGVSFIKGKSTITVNTAMPSLKDFDTSVPTIDELEDKFDLEMLCTNHLEAVTNRVNIKPRK